MKLSIITAILLTIFTIIGSQVSAQTFLTQKELLSIFPGATMYGISNNDGKTKWVQTYGKGKRKGNISGLWGNDKYKSKWYVKNGQWCEDWGISKACWDIEQVEPKKLRMYKKGKPLKHLRNIK